MIKDEVRIGIAKLDQFGLVVFGKCDLQVTNIVLKAFYSQSFPLPSPLLPCQPALYLGHPAHYL